MVQTLCHVQVPRLRLHPYAILAPFNDPAPQEKDPAGAGSWIHVVLEPYFLKGLNSTRRFFARFSLVSLGYRGMLQP